MDLGGVFVKKESLEENKSSEYSDFLLAELWQSPIGWTDTVQR